MKLSEINTSIEKFIQVKISKNSITVLNDNTMKTKGIIRNITSFYNLQPNKQFDLHKSIKGIISHEYLKNVYYTIDKEIVFLFPVNIMIGYESDNTKEYYYKMLEHVKSLPDDIKVIYVRKRI